MDMLRIPLGRAFQAIGNVFHDARFICDLGCTFSFTTYLVLKKHAVGCFDTLGIRGVGAAWEPSQSFFAFPNHDADIMKDLLQALAGFQISSQPSLLPERRRECVGGELWNGRSLRRLLPGLRLLLLFEQLVELCIRFLDRGNALVDRLHVLFVLGFEGFHSFPVLRPARLSAAPRNFLPFFRTHFHQARLAALLADLRQIVADVVHGPECKA